MAWIVPRLLWFRVYRALEVDAVGSLAVGAVSLRVDESVRSMLPCAVHGTADHYFFGRTASPNEGY